MYHSVGRSHPFRWNFRLQVCLWVYLTSLITTVLVIVNVTKAQSGNRFSRLGGFDNQILSNWCRTEQNSLPLIRMSVVHHTASFLATLWHKQGAFLEPQNYYYLYYYHIIGEASLMEQELYSVSPWAGLAFRGGWWNPLMFLSKLHPRTRRHP